MSSLVPCILPDQLAQGSLPQIYELSFQSQQSRDKVQQFTRFWFKSCTMNITSTTVDIRGDSSSNTDHIKWEFRDKELMTDSDKRSLHTRVLINGNQLKFVEENEHSAICYSDDIFTDMRILCDYLITILNSSFQKLTINPYQFEDKSIDYQNFERPELLEVSTSTVTYEEMKHFLEGFQGVPKKILNCYPGKRFVLDKPLSGDHLIIYYGQWVKLHNLLNLNCTGLKLANCDLTSQDFNAFIKHWLISDNQKLEYLFVRGKVDKGEDDEEVCGFTKLNRNAVIKDIESIGKFSYRGMKTSYDGKSFGITYHWAQGFNVQRTDGRIASIIIQQKPSRRVHHFLFIVWKPKSINQ